MRLFTPVAADEAESLIRAVPLPGALFWVDRDALDEAEAHAVWVEIEVPDREVGPFERPVDAVLGYREFELPAAFAARFVAKLVS